MKRQWIHKDLEFIDSRRKEWQTLKLSPCYQNRLVVDELLRTAKHMFWQWLYDHGYADKYITAVIIYIQNQKLSIYSWWETIADSNEYKDVNLIGWAFDWQYTKDGPSFWRGVYLKWDSYLNI